MTPLRIKPVEAEVEPGDFGIVVKEPDLLVPEAVVHAVPPGDIRTVTDFVSYMDAFPSAVASLLHWSVSDVHHGLGKLRAQLRGHVDDSVVEPVRRPRFAYGALNPNATCHE